MDVKLALAAYILPGLAVVLGFPMALRLIPPNRFYRYRTRKTLSSADIWYPANHVAGWSLAIAGIVALGHNILFRHDHAGLSSTTQQLFMTAATALLILLALAFSALYVRKL